MPAPSSISKEAPASRSAVLLMSLVHAYRVLLSPLLGGNCKFYPTCSRYAQEAIAVYGARRGAWLAFTRLIRCVPFTRGGIDLVPPAPGAPAASYAKVVEPAK